VTWYDGGTGRFSIQKLVTASNVFARCRILIAIDIRAANTWIGTASPPSRLTILLDRDLLVAVRDDPFNQR
jgi:hypothetical protein